MPQAKKLDFSDLGAKPVIDFSDLGARPDTDARGKISESAKSKISKVVDPAKNLVASPPKESTFTTRYDEALINILEPFSARDAKGNWQIPPVVQGGIDTAKAVSLLFSANPLEGIRQLKDLAKGAVTGVVEPPVTYVKSAAAGDWDAAAGASGRILTQTVPAVGGAGESAVGRLRNVAKANAPVWAERLQAGAQESRAIQAKAPSIALSKESTLFGTAAELGARGARKVKIPIQERLAKVIAGETPEVSPGMMRPTARKAAESAAKKEAQAWATAQREVASEARARAQAAATARREAAIEARAKAQAAKLESERLAAEAAAQEEALRLDPSNPDNWPQDFTFKRTGPAGPISGELPPVSGLKLEGSGFDAAKTPQMIEGRTNRKLDFGSTPETPAFGPPSPPPALGLERTAPNVNKWMNVREKQLVYGNNPAQQILDDGLLGADKATTLLNVTTARKSVGSQLEQSFKSAGDQGVRFNIESEIRDAIADAKKTIGKRTDEGFMKAIEGIKDDITGRTNDLKSMTPSEAHALEKELGNAINWESAVNPAPDITRLLKDIRGRISKALKSGVKDAASLKDRWGNLYEAEKALQSSIRKDKIGRGSGDTPPAVQSRREARELLNQPTP